MKYDTVNIFETSTTKQPGTYNGANKIYHHHDSNNNDHHDSTDMVNFPPSSEWTYDCEGGKHAVFRYTGQNNNISYNKNMNTTFDWTGKLLRVDKAIFRQIQTPNNDEPEIHHHHNNNNRENHSQTLKVTLSLDHDPFRSRLYQIFSPYVDRPYRMQQHHHHHPTHSETPIDTYMASLRDNAIATQQIPPRRLPDWVQSASTTTTSSTFSITSTSTSTTAGILLLQDYRWLTHLNMNTKADQNSTRNQHHPWICIELKPKCGFTSIAPFSKCRNKYHTSRYVLQQKLYQTRQCTKDWMNEELLLNSATSTDATNPTTTFHRSQYDPLDLFSKNVTRMQNAIRHLTACPQNNFKLWYQHQLFIGRGGTSTSNTNTNDTTLDWRRLGQSIGIPIPTKSEKQDVLDYVVDLTTTVLVEDEFLHRLLSLQKLDLLDSDGAMAVYQRLMELCDHNETLAESLVDAPIQWVQQSDVTTTALDRENDEIDTVRNIPTLLKHCPIQLPEKHSNIVQLCNEVEVMAFRLSQSNSISSLSTEDIEIHRHRAHTIIDALSIEECCYLLQSWLLSLAICDVTFFLNFQFVPTTNDNLNASGEDHMSTVTNDKSRFRMRSFQSHVENGTPGCIEYHNDITNEYHHIHYQIKVIDLDRKPAKKIKSRYVKERQFDGV